MATRRATAITAAGAMTVLLLATATALRAQGGWTQGPPIPDRANEVIGTAVDGQLVVYGGQNARSEPMGIFWKFDPASGQWAKLPSNPVPAHHGATVAVGRRMYVVGAFRLPENSRTGWYPENRAWVFDFDTQTWRALPPMPTARGALSAVAAVAVIGRRLYAVSGVNNAGGAGTLAVVNVNEIFEP